MRQRRTRHGHAWIRVTPEPTEGQQTNLMPLGVKPDAPCSRPESDPAPEPAGPGGAARRVCGHVSSLTKHWVPWFHRPHSRVLPIQLRRSGVCLRVKRSASLSDLFHRSPRRSWSFSTSLPFCLCPETRGVSWVPQADPQWWGWLPTALKTPLPASPCSQPHLPEVLACRGHGTMSASDCGKVWTGLQ